jgi:hypothetical protein
MEPLEIQLRDLYLYYELLPVVALVVARVYALLCLDGHEHRLAEARVDALLCLDGYEYRLAEARVDALQCLDGHEHRLVEVRVDGLVLWSAETLLVVDILDVVAPNLHLGHNQHYLADTHGIQAHKADQLVVVYYMYLAVDADQAGMVGKAGRPDHTVAGVGSILSRETWFEVEYSTEMWEVVGNLVVEETQMEVEDNTELDEWVEARLVLVNQWLPTWLREGCTPGPCLCSHSGYCEVSHQRHRTP